MTQNDSLTGTHSMYWPLIFTAQTSKPSQVALCQCLGMYNQQVMMIFDSKNDLNYLCHDVQTYDRTFTPSEANVFFTNSEFKGAYTSLY